MQCHRIRGAANTDIFSISADERMEGGSQWSINDTETANGIEE